MWKPPERIRYRTHPGEWPTAAVAAASTIFMPLNYQALSLSARTWVPAMVPWRATETGFVTPDNLDWYERFARGQPGVLVVEATGIRDIASGPLLRISDDRFIPGLQTLVERVRAASNGQTRFQSHARGPSPGPRSVLRARVPDSSTARRVLMRLRRLRMAIYRAGFGNGYVLVASTLG